MKKQIMKLSMALLCSSTLSFGADILAIVNGHNITTEVAPKNFDTLDKQMQHKIINRLVEKRLACDYALSTKVPKTKEYQKTLKHVLQMGNKNIKKNDKNFLANVLKDNATIKGYTAEQLYSKKGLLAFDFLVNDYAKTIKPTNKELKKYYELHKYKYDTPAMKELLIITAKDLATAKKILKQLDTTKELKASKFMELASKYSLSKDMYENGYFGKIPTKELNSKIKKYLEKLKRGQWTHQPIHTEFGYELYFVVNDIPEFKSTLKSVKSKVEYEYTNEKVKQWAMQLIKDLKSKARITIKK